MVVKATYLSDEVRWMAQETYQCNSINPMALAKQAGLMRNAASDDLRLAGQAAFMMDRESSSYT